MMPVDFTDFAYSCESRGYKAVDQRASTSDAANIFYIRTKNNVKVEIKALRAKSFYVAGQGLNADKLSFLYKELVANNKTILKQNKKHLHIDFEANIIEGFWNLVSTIEDIDQLIQQQRSNRFYQAVYDDNVFMYVAADIANMLKYCPPGSPWSRGKIFDDIDKMITIGYSIRGRQQELSGKNAYREHAVPIDWCINKAFNMFKENKTIEDVAKMLQRNIKLVLISDDEQHLLDNKLGMRISMPQGFDDGQDPLIRIKNAGIILENKA